jgi:hypothetical protein
MKKLFAIFVALLAIAQVSYAQWTGGPTGNVYYNGGNVGIGIPNPANKLQVGGNIVAEGGSLIMSNFRPTLVATDTEQGSDLKNWDIHTALGVINFRLANDIYNAANNWMTVTRSGFVPTSVSFPSGNVGIGTGSPRALFDVRSGSTLTGGDVPGTAVITSPHQTLYQGTLSLESNSPVTANQGGTLVFKGTYEGNAPAAYGAIGGFKENGVSSNYAGYLAFFSRTHAGLNDERMRITSSGNVGIGTTTPDAKLAVNGSVHAKEVKVNLIGWPDYVFNKDYHRLTLKEIEDYIATNHHLPEMPSAENIVKNGVNLGEMVKLQTKKIEELTLHLIDKEQQLAAEKLVNKQQETRLKAIEEILLKLTSKQ